MLPISCALLLAILLKRHQADPVCPHDLDPAYNGYWDHVSGKCFTWLNVKESGLARTYDNDMERCSKHFLNGVIAPVFARYFTDISAGRKKVHSGAFLVYANLPHPTFWNAKNNSWILNGNLIRSIQTEITNASYSLRFTLKNPLNTTETSSLRQASYDRVIQMDDTGLPLNLKTAIELDKLPSKGPLCMKYKWTADTYSPMKVTSCKAGDWQGLICASDALEHCTIKRLNGAVYCSCRQGYTGKYCERPVDKCQSNPCGSSRHCVNGVEDYFCKCFDGIFTKDCDVGPPERGTGRSLLILLWVICSMHIIPIFGLACTIARILYPESKLFKFLDGLRCCRKAQREMGKQRDLQDADKVSKWKNPFSQQKQIIKEEPIVSTGKTSRPDRRGDDENSDENVAAVHIPRLSDSDKSDGTRSLGILLVQL
uniref:EGF-like domain-containing protein n=1 Tax=Trichuris muris TaxID=70415 RepID=A0A5S6QF93_TRIMR